ncbi:co-chaperone DjlA [Marinobacterium sediminicola]|uniref:Co-chaperone protein DjlA n=1 Tax=Marinobacterium sediminicola TaxID=518898 RepID=A0ABY1RYK3_9GAMM|nr:co-chaperone DjlA [Marinobacterium sediminicola]ULG68696.1 co-chaperone DjlA [Marinobacterium sediminicola]SMR73220.1 DnaJ like chaperone protein [Marinobacterium sediminicola]
MQDLIAQLKQFRTGLIVGGLIGLLTGGPIGLLLGGTVGFLLQRSLSNKLRAYNPQQLFFRATFCVMGKLAKADGRVSESEIAFAREVMTRMGLSEARRMEAIECFNEGKSEAFDIAEVMRPLAILLRQRAAVKLMFVEIQLQAAMADGEVSAAEQAVLQQVFAHLQFSQQEVELLMSRMRAEDAFRRHSWDSHQHGGGVNDASLLADAYGVIGVSAEASDAEVKKAWRKLMSQHHPDKLIAKGLPEDMVQLAKEKTQEIQAAYDRIKAARGMR